MPRNYRDLSMDNQEEWTALLTVKEIGQILRVGQTKPYLLIKEGAFPATRIGKSIRVPKCGFIKWLNGKKS